MQNEMIDVGRLDVLRAVSAREAGALDLARQELHADMAKAGDIRKMLLAKGRTPERRLSANIERLEAEKKAIENRIAEREQTVEILQERVTAAKRLRKRCEIWVTQTVSGVAQ